MFVGSYGKDLSIQGLFRSGGFRLPTVLAALLLSSLIALETGGCMHITIDAFLHAKEIIHFIVVFIPAFLIYVPKPQSPVAAHLGASLDPNR